MTFANKIRLNENERLKYANVSVFVFTIAFPRNIAKLVLFVEYCNMESVHNNTIGMDFPSSRLQSTSDFNRKHGKPICRWWRYFPWNAFHSSSTYLLTFRDQVIIFGIVMLEAWNKNETRPRSVEKIKATYILQLCKSFSAEKGM